MSALVKTDEVPNQVLPTGAAVVHVKEKGVVQIAVTPEFLQNVTGVNDPKVAQRLATQLLAMQVFGDEQINADQVNSALGLLGGLEPKNATEALLAVQMFGVHEAALRFLQLATMRGQSLENSDSNLGKATKLLKLFNEQLEAMAKLKGKTGQQKVTVEHVHVHNGGKAIVGNVNTMQGIEGEVGGQIENERITP